MSCAVRGCRSVWNPTSSLKLHSFPKDPKRRNIWLSILHLKQPFYKQSAKVCSLHFRPEDYEPNPPGRLHRNAKPIYFTKTCECKTEKICNQEPGPVMCTAFTPTDMQKGGFKQQALIDNILRSALTSTVTHQTLYATHAESLHLRPQCSKTASLAVTQLLPALPSTVDHTYAEPMHRQLEFSKTSSFKATRARDDEEPSARRRDLQDFSMQVEMKTVREKSLEKTNKILQQKVRRLESRLSGLKSVIDVVRNYTSQSEIENILQGNFLNLRDLFKRTPFKNKGVRYSEKVKAFALRLHFYSPKAYEYLRTIVSLPHQTTLERNTFHVLNVIGSDDPTADIPDGSEIVDYSAD